MCVMDGETASNCGVIFSELVGNAVRHAPGPLNLSLEFREGEADLHVIDSGPGFQYQPVLPDDVWSESGRGLFLVSKLARRVHVERIPGNGSHIVATLPLGCFRPSIRGEVEANPHRRIDPMGIIV
jgi:anti-sigma regulatory factor (Ser/Thr protein kinase)